MSRFDKTKVLLDQVYHGRAVGESLWSEASREIRDAETYTEVVVTGTGAEMTPGDAAVLMAGRLFIELENVIVALRRAGQVSAVSTDVVNAMIDAKAMLKQAGYEPVANRKADPLVFNKARP